MDAIKKNAIKKLHDLVKTARSPQLPTTLPMEKYLELLDEMYKMSIYYAEDGRDDEKAYILNLRYVSIVFEELPHCLNYHALPELQRLELDEQAIQTILNTEPLKQRILFKYEQEQQQEQNQQLIDSIPSTSSSSSSNSRNKPPALQLNEEPLLFDDAQQLLSPYVQCHFTTHQQIMFKHMFIPSNTHELFMANAWPSIPTPSAAAAGGGGDGPTAAEQSVAADPTVVDPQFHIAILYGRIMIMGGKTVLVIYKMLPCTADAFQTNPNYHRYVDTSTGEEVSMVGFICSSLEMANELELFQKCQMQEMVCIVCSPRLRNPKILHLVKMVNGSLAFAKMNSDKNTTVCSCEHLLITTAINTTLIDEQQHRRYLQQLNGEKNRKRCAAQPAQMPSSMMQNNGMEPTAKMPKLHAMVARTPSPFLLLAPHKVEVVHLDPLVLIFRAVISDTEIFTIKTLASKKLCRAKVVDPNSGKTALANYRVSKSAWLKDGVHPVVERITKRVHDMTNLDTESAEDLQVASYGIGGHYAPHFDFFRSNEVDKRTFELFGNRIATVLFYLTQPHDGGYTIFTDMNIGIEPTEHDALFWYNLRSDGSVDPRTRHAACPVLSGFKWVANKWLHERGQEFIRQC
ncbi:hypothetical protein niasHT_014306 [Heterodera trifolii]|uniref:Fe2OG dioxygenase domain-containing protein n=1 Tax=Heterodera trifolii TaxID=157864 RepID=A0ABD2L8M0_9BILA